MEISEVSLWNVGLQLVEFSCVNQTKSSSSRSQLITVCTQRKSAGAQNRNYCNSFPHVEPLQSILAFPHLLNPMLILTVLISLLSCGGKVIVYNVCNKKIVLFFLNARVLHNWFKLSTIFRITVQTEIKFVFSFINCFIILL